MKKVLVGAFIVGVSLFAYTTYKKADTGNIRISVFNDKLTLDKQATGDIYISNRNDYPVKNITIECVGATDNINALVEVYSKTYNTYIPANSSKEFKNEYLGHYTSKVTTVICVTVTEAHR